MFKGSTFHKAVYTEAPPRAVGVGAARAAPLFMLYIRPLDPPKSYLKYAKPQHVHAEPAGADSALLDMSSSQSCDYALSIQRCTLFAREWSDFVGVTSIFARALNCYKLFYREPPPLLNTFLRPCHLRT